VGCILYEMLTGTVPYAGADAATVLEGHLGGALEPPTRRAPHLGIPRVIEGVIERAMERDPARRFPSMDALAEALERALDGQVRSAASEPPRGEVDRPPAPSMTAAMTAATPSGPRRRAGLATVGALIVAGGAIAITVAALRRTTTTTTRTPTSAAPPALPAPAPAPAPIVASPPPPPPATPSAREVTIDSDPPGADVFHGPERLGTTPLRYALDDGVDALDVSLSKRGFAPHLLRISSTGTRAYAVTLRALDHRARPTAPAPRPTATPPTATPPPDDHPNVVPRELKDVFSD
jgi:serine/threonine-protein kinase